MSLSELTDVLTSLPGLGPRQARRVVEYLLRKDSAYRERLAALIAGARLEVSECTRCFRFDAPSASGLCRTCADGSRDASLLMVVEHDVDIDAIEAALTYRGYYFVLGGLLNLVKQRKDKILRTRELLERITPEVREVICALAATPEGDYTAKELMTQIRAARPGVAVSVLGRGLSVGAELEYADPETLRSALKNRG
ncbi:toprim domain-containing protein [Patescibacteria group bacterium]|nr:toprim domain-containing protein [Patescibacteria group bacterium]